MNKKAIIGIAAGAVAVIVIVILALTLGKKDSYRSVEVYGTSGTASVLRADSKMDAVVNLALIPEDKATTEETSSLDLKVDTDKYIHVSEKSRISINATGNVKKGRVAVDLDYGATLIKIENKLQDDDSFDVTTPNATMAVRGTEFSVEYDEKTQTTTVTVTSGRVEVTHRSLGTSEIVDAGFTCIVTNDDITVSKDPQSGDKTSQNKLLTSEPSQDWKPYIDQAISDAKSDGAREINIKTVQDYVDYKNSGDCDNAILYFESKEYDFTEEGAFLLDRVHDVIFVGTGDTRIVVKTGFDLVLETYDTDNVTFYGFIMGHDLPIYSECSAGVVWVTESRNLSIINCDIFGCGLSGIGAYDSEVNLKGTTIRDCASTAMDLETAAIINLEDCVIKGNNYKGALDGDYHGVPLINGYTDNGEKAIVNMLNCKCIDNLNTVLYDTEYIALNDEGTVYSGNGFN